MQKQPIDQLLNPNIINESPQTMKKQCSSSNQNSCNEFENDKTQDSINLVSIIDFEVSEIKQQIINSPRSLEACKSLGIMPKDLQMKKVNQIQQIMNERRVPITPDSLQHFILNFELKRREKIEKVRRAYQEIVNQEYLSNSNLSHLNSPTKRRSKKLSMSYRQPSFSPQNQNNLRLIQTQNSFSHQNSSKNNKTITFSQTNRIYRPSSSENVSQNCQFSQSFQDFKTNLQLKTQRSVQRANRQKELELNNVLLQELIQRKQSVNNTYKDHYSNLIQQQKAQQTNQNIIEQQEQRLLKQEQIFINIHSQDMKKAEQIQEKSEKDLQRLEAQQHQALLNQELQRQKQIQHQLKQEQVDHNLNQFQTQTLNQNQQYIVKKQLKSHSVENQKLQEKQMIFEKQQQKKDLMDFKLYQVQLNDEQNYQNQRNNLQEKQINSEHKVYKVQQNLKEKIHEKILKSQEKNKQIQTFNNVLEEKRFNQRQKYMQILGKQEMQVLNQKLQSLYHTFQKKEKSEEKIKKYQTQKKTQEKQEQRQQIKNFNFRQKKAEIQKEKLHESQIQSIINKQTNSQIKQINAYDTLNQQNLQQQTKNEEILQKRREKQDLIELKQEMMYTQINQSQLTIRDINFDKDMIKDSIRNKFIKNYRTNIANIVDQYELTTNIPSSLGRFQDINKEESELYNPTQNQHQGSFYQSYNGFQRKNYQQNKRPQSSIHGNGRRN